MSAPSPALVHDYLLVYRGAERTFARIAEIWPRSPVYTLLYDGDIAREHFTGHSVTASRLQKLGVGQPNFRRLLPLFPPAAERLPVTNHDLVVSSSSAFALGVRPGPGAVHVCYCHSPFRYVWHERDRGLQEAPRVARPVLRGVLGRMKAWDVSASTRVTHFVANSKVTQQRIADSYGRDSVVIHPPVEVARFERAEPEDYAVFVGEVVRHKQVGLALEAAKRAGVRMKVIGTGPDLDRMRAHYGERADFLGRIDDTQVAAVMARARVAVLPNVEEFGITAVEAQASGRPVLAADAGGARETVIDGETGVLASPGSVDEFAEALRHVNFEAFNPAAMIKNASRFAPEIFQRTFQDAVNRITG